MRPVASSSVGKWRNHLPRVAGQLALHGDRAIAESLIEYGYESDDSWLKELEGITPDYSESHWPEHFTKKELKDRTRGKYSRALMAFLRNISLD